MSLHSTIKGRSRKSLFLLNGPRDNDMLAFDVYVTIPKTAGATVIIPDTQVPSDWYIYLDDYKFIQPGTTWSGGTNFILHESTGTSVPLITVTVANSGMPTTAAPIDRVQPTTRTGLTEGAALVNGLAAGKGISITVAGTMSAGSDMTVRLIGVIRPKTAEVFG